MMRKMGISIEEMEGVEEVLIKTAEKEYVFKNAEVTVMNAQGKKTYQISGSPEIIEKVREEDVELVAEKSGKSAEEAREALTKCKGDIAQAIIKLSSP
jgi:nascent polypeptide-associated complex subunit alpha